MSKVLIIDDERPVRVAIEKLVNWEEFGVTKILSASNGKEGLEIMRKEEPEFIFLDICMPIMNGLEFLECSKEEYPCSQFIIVSGYDDFHYAQNAIRFGATDYLLKPIERQTINEALRQAAAKLTKALEDAPLQNDFLDNPDNEEPMNTEQVVYTIRDYIDSHYSENIKISMFSEKYFFSKEYISRNFKSTFGYGIYEYVLTVRMKKASKLLRNPDTKISEIGKQVGFTDNNHFSKAFKNYYNVSPTEYRKQQLGDSAN